MKKIKKLYCFDAPVVRNFGKRAYVAEMEDGVQIVCTMTEKKRNSNGLISEAGITFALPLDRYEYRKGDVSEIPAYEYGVLCDYDSIIANYNDGVVWANKIKELRRNKGMSQSDLAESAGITLRSLQAYEQGVRLLGGASAIDVYKLAKCLGTTVENLLEHN